ncbi:hypothetical protein SKAU_G00159910 [Synaphobranchus kaupii]|uniref:Uncharacterized protein n=1 Tax=Synaphobranchus kaupii TaxID=118154 RepID=A0A9Q1FIG3_SYNKA|nr:hypothetical protein SKAU_G00159910 [Synaphobranchus kaupii]
MVPSSQELNPNDLISPLDLIVGQQKLELIMHPVVLKLISVKWNLYGKLGAWILLLFNALFIISWTGVAISVSVVRDKEHPYEFPRVPSSSPTHRKECKNRLYIVLKAISQWAWHDTVVLVVTSGATKIETEEPEGLMKDPSLAVTPNAIFRLARTAVLTQLRTREASRSPIRAAISTLNCIPA